MPVSADADKLSDGAKVIFGIRPEAVNDTESIDRNARSVATFDATVEIVEPAGSDTYVVTRAAGKELTRACAPRRRSASVKTTPSPSTSTKRCCSILRRRDEFDATRAAKSMRRDD